MRKKLMGAVMALGMLPVAVGAATGNDASAWIRIPTDIRSAAMGGASAALFEQADSIVGNPAGLAFLDAPSVSFSQSFWVQGLSLEHGIFAAPTGGLGFAFGGDYLNFGSVDAITVGPGGPTQTGTITPSALDVVGGIGFALPEGFGAGATLKFIGQSLANDWSSTLGLDLGILYKSRFGLSAGAAFRNMGPTLDGFDLPFEVSAGAAYNVNLSQDFGGARGADHAGTLAAQWDELPHSGLSSWSVGGEYWYRHTVGLRAGYRFAQYGESDGLTGLSFGAGLRLSGLELSYAMTTLGSLGNTNQISLAFRL